MKNCSFNGKEETKREDKAREEDKRERYVKKQSTKK